jgi:hypothetical protein
MSTLGFTEAVDFLAAIGTENGQDRLQHAVIVYSMEMWRHLALK